MRALLLLMFLTFLTLRVAGKERDSIPWYDTSYYVSLRDKLTLYTYGISKFSQFELYNSTTDKYLSYQPNTRFNLGLGFSYKWLGLSTSFNFRFINSDDEIYGETSSYDIQADFYTRRMIIGANVQTYQGFYWENTSEYDSLYTDADSFLIRPDIVTTNIGLNFIYTFKNTRFSFKAAFSNTEWQKKSAGSWLAGGFASLYGISADSSIVPPRARENFPSYYGVNGFGLFNIGASFGYTYTFVWRKKIFINATLMLGLMDQALLAEDTAGNLVIASNHVSSQSHFRFAIGYNSEKQNFGISAIASNFIVQNKSDNEFSYDYGRVYLFYARRFNLNLNWKK
jgi:hypothetical protein